MRTIIRKWFWAWDFDKEEAWLNEMASEGLALVSVGWCRYEFEPCEPGEYIVRLQLLEKKRRSPESEEYLAFLEETGAEHVGSWMDWVYLRRKASEGPFELFSDNVSRIRQLGVIKMFIAVIGGLNLYIAVYNLILFAMMRIGFNLLGLLNLAIGIAAMIGVYRLHRKQEQLKAEQNLFE
jgi:hypothetical protein